MAKQTKVAMTLATVRRFLQEDKLESYPLPDDMLGSELDDGRGAVKVIFLPDEEFDFLQVWAAPDDADEIPEAERDAFMRKITQANAELEFGNFYLNLTTGEWGFRVGCDFSKSTLTTEMVASMVYCANERIHQYFPAPPAPRQ